MRKPIWIRAMAWFSWVFAAAGWCGAFYGSAHNIQGASVLALAVVVWGGWAVSFCLVVLWAALSLWWRAQVSKAKLTQAQGVRQMPRSQDPPTAQTGTGKP